MSIRHAWGLVMTLSNNKYFILQWKESLSSHSTPRLQRPGPLTLCHQPSKHLVWYWNCPTSSTTMLCQVVTIRSWFKYSLTWTATFDTFDPSEEGWANIWSRRMREKCLSNDFYVYSFIYLHVSSASSADEWGLMRTLTLTLISSATLPLMLPSDSIRLRDASRHSPTAVKW